MSDESNVSRVHESEESRGNLICEYTIWLAEITIAKRIRNGKYEPNGHHTMVVVKGSDDRIKSCSLVLARLCKDLNYKRKQFESKIVKILDINKYQRCGKSRYLN